MAGSESHEAGNCLCLRVLLTWGVSVNIVQVSVLVVPLQLSWVSCQEQCLMCVCWAGCWRGCPLGVWRADGNSLEHITWPNSASVKTNKETALFEGQRCAYANKWRGFLLSLVQWGFFRFWGLCVFQGVSSGSIFCPSGCRNLTGHSLSVVWKEWISPSSESCSIILANPPKIPFLLYMLHGGVSGLSCAIKVIRVPAIEKWCSEAAEIWEERGSETEERNQTIPYHTL